MTAPSISLSRVLRIVQYWIGINFPDQADDDIDNDMIKNLHTMSTGCFGILVYGHLIII